MSVAKDPISSTLEPTYEEDFYAWAFAQAELLAQKRFSELDLPNIIEEIESLGRDQSRALKSSYRLLIVHLLKWQFQQHRRSRSWNITIIRERANIVDREEDNRTLRNKAPRLVEDVYRQAVREAMVETDLLREAFPAECPYTVEQLRDPDWMPV